MADIPSYNPLDENNLPTYRLITGHRAIAIKIYSSKRWKNLKKLIINNNPICNLCRSELATEIDHIKPIKTNPELAYSISNLQPLCKRCHSRKTIGGQ